MDGTLEPNAEDQWKRDSSRKTATESKGQELLISEESKKRGQDLNLPQHEIINILFGKSTVFEAGINKKESQDGVLKTVNLEGGNIHDLQVRMDWGK